MGCPAMDFIEEDIREALLRDPDVDAVEIEVVWDPVWTKNRLRADARGEDARAGDRGMSRAGETVWEVFARKAYEEPLHHVGTVTESDEDLALVVGARDLRRAAVDPHDPRAAAGDPRGDPRMTQRRPTRSTAPPRR